MQKLYNGLTEWCHENKLAINCEVNKTEAIILKTGGEPSSEEEQPPQLKINGQCIRYVKSTKVLGVILDDELNFELHANNKLIECKKKWGLITKSTNRNKGLNTRSLTLLWKTMILTKLMYAAPIWLWKNMRTYKGFYQNAIMKITGSMLNPKRSLVELAMHLPPLEITLQTLTVKFLCKVLSADDNLTSVLLQIEGSQPDYFHHLLTSIKEFIHWKYPDKFGRRTFTVDLLQLKEQDLSLHYSEGEIMCYQKHIWERLITNQLSIAGSNPTNDNTSKLISGIDDAIGFDRKDFLFNHGTSKREDSFILDYIHGNSLLFGNCRKRMQLGEDRCYFCQKEEDGPFHQLFMCEDVQDSTHSKLISVIQNPLNYVQEVLIPNNQEVQFQFIERIRFLMGQHDLVEELEKLKDKGQQ